MSDDDKDGFIGSHGDRLENVPTGEGGADVPTGAGGGGALAEALGDREAADRDEDQTPAAATGAVGADAGSPGGMGGVRGGMSNPESRPNGGVSPIQDDGHDAPR